MNKYTIVTIALLTSFQLHSQITSNSKHIHDQIQDQTDKIYEDLVLMRRDFHQHPELSGNEKNTAEKIKNYLTQIGLEVKTNIGGYGVVGILQGHREGKQIAWRADIDAFHSDFPDVVAFHSLNPGVRHICGHDVHTTIALGIAKVLSAHRDKIAGTVYFIFQPAEEYFTGAKSMLSSELFKQINPVEIYGLHMNPAPIGTITTKENELYAYARKLLIEIKHGKNSEEIANYIDHIIRHFNTVDERFWNFTNLANTQIGISSNYSIYKEYVAIHEKIHIKKEKNKTQMEVNFFATDAAFVNEFPALVSQIIKASKYARKIHAIHYIAEIPTVKNDPNLTAVAMNTLKEVYGQNAVITAQGIVPGSNDDFAYFQEKIPGVYFTLGGSNFPKGIIARPHTPNFAVDEESIRVGVKYFSSLLLERFNLE